MHLPSICTYVVIYDSYHIICMYNIQESFGEFAYTVHTSVHILSSLGNEFATHAYIDTRIYICMHTYVCIIERRVSNIKNM